MAAKVKKKFHAWMRTPDPLIWVCMRCGAVKTEAKRKKSIALPRRECPGASDAN